MGSPVFHNNSLFILITPFLSMIFLKKLCVAKSCVVSRKQIITISEFVECQLVIPWDYVIYVRYAQDKPILSSDFPAKGARLCSTNIGHVSIFKSESKYFNSDQ